MIDLTDRHGEDDIVKFPARELHNVLRVES